MSLSLATAALIGAGITSAASMANTAMNANAVANSNAPLWKQAMWNDRLAANAARRQYEYSMDAWREQTMAGPGLSVNAYRNAGLNPALVADFNGNSVPIMGGQQGAPLDYHKQVRQTDFASGLSNMVSTYLNAKDLESRVALQEANAKAVEQNAETRASLADVQKSLLALKGQTEKEMPAHIRQQVQKMAGEALLNSYKADLIQSQKAVNAKQLDNLSSQIDYRRQMLDILGRKDFIGFGRFGGIHFNIHKILQSINEQPSSVPEWQGSGRVLGR